MQFKIISNTWLLGEEFPHPFPRELSIILKRYLKKKYLILKTYFELKQETVIGTFQRDWIPQNKTIPKKVDMIHWTG